MDRDQLRTPLDAAALRAELIGTGLGWRHLEVVEETGSTNADLIARAAAGEDIDGAVLIAEHQTAGRGRTDAYGRPRPRAQITMSVGVGAGDVPTAGVGLAAAGHRRRCGGRGAAVTGVQAGLKWPNDVLAGDREARRHPCRGGPSGRSSRSAWGST